MKSYGNIVIGIIAIAALAISLVGFKQGSVSQSSSLSDRVIQKGELRIGYIVYPPSLIKDPATGKLSGVWYDLVEAAAKNLNLKTNWVEEVSWGSAIEGLKTKRYDMVGTQMWPNAARAREAVFSIAPMNSVLYPYVRTGDKRFSADLTKLNSSQFTISTMDGEMASFIAQSDYPQAKVNALPQQSSISEMFLNVVANKADITFQEPGSAKLFMKSNPGKIEQLGTTPVRTFGNSFVFARGEDSMVAMWNVAVRELINDGTVARTLQKYGVSDDFTLNH